MTITVEASLKTIIDKVEALAATAANKDKAMLQQLSTDLSSTLNAAKDYTDTQLAQKITEILGGAPITANTLKELNDSIVANFQADAGAVSAKAAQNFTDAEKTRALANIGAASQTSVADALSQAAAAATAAAAAQTSATAAQTAVAAASSAVTALSNSIGNMAQIEADANAFNPVATFTSALTS